MKKIFYDYSTYTLNHRKKKAGAIPGLFFLEGKFRFHMSGISGAISDLTKVG